MRVGQEPEERAGCRVIRETAKALLVCLDDGREVWIPKSQIHDDSEIWKPGDAGTLVVNGWWAEKEGI
jgi:hypothetical protein